VAQVVKSEALAIRNLDACRGCSRTQVIPDVSDERQIAELDFAEAFEDFIMAERKWNCPASAGTGEGVLPLR
jgi:hypothetical protein